MQSRYSESYSDALPDFVKLAEAYGWKGIRIETRDQLDPGIAEMLAHDGPVLVRLQGGQARQLLPDDPVGRRPYRNAAPTRPKSRARWTTKPRRWSDPMHIKEEAAERHTLAVIVDNEPGILARIAGLFTARGYNIDVAHRVRDQRRRPDQPDHHRHRGLGPR